MTYYYNGSTTASVSDAADILAGATYDDNNTSYGLYSYDGDIAENDTIGIRFTNVTIPKSDPIYWAKLRIWTSGDGGNFIIYAVANNNEPVFSSSNRPKNQTVTTAHTHVTLGSGTTVITEIDVRAIVQEIVNRTGWASGNAISFIIKDQSVSEVASTSYHTYDGGYYSSLTILSGVERTAPDAGGRVQVNINDVWKTVGTMYINGDEKLNEFNYTMADYGWGASFWYPEQVGQTFTVGTVGVNENISLDKIKIRTECTGSMTPSHVALQLKAVDGSGHPTGSALSTSTGWTTDGIWSVAQMTPYTLVAGTKYAFICIPDMGDIDNMFIMKGQYYNTYSGGDVQDSPTGTTWTTYDVDFDFEVWGGGGWKPIVGMKINVGDVWDTIF